MSFVAFLADRWPEILRLTLEHVVLVVASVGAGVAIAVPLGLAITRIPALGGRYSDSRESSRRSLRSPFSAS